MQTKTKRITESAMLIAMAIVLELVSKAFIPEMPFGGQITLASMLPVILISYRHGVKWGLVAGVAYALMEMVLGARTVAAAFQPGYFGDGRMIGNALIMCLLDYVAAYTLLGLGGLFRNCVKSKTVALVLGVLVAVGLRYVAHIVSGYIFYGAWAEWFFSQEGWFHGFGEWLMARVSGKSLALIYSIFYNGLYMIPEIIITAIVALPISAIRPIKKADA